MATPRAQNTPEDRAHGIVVLEPEGSAGPVRHAQLDALCVALSGAANAQAERLAGRADITLDFGGEGCDRAAPGAALALFAAPLAGVDDRFVLREIRSGFATPALETDLDMGGGAITFAAPAQGQAGRPPRGRIDLPALTLTAGLDVSGQVSVRRAEISGGFVAHGPARTGGNLVIDGPATVGGCLRIEGPLRLGRLIATKGAGCRP
ncbi:hypothetical protein [Ruegeria sp.]|uniref:hypothetical protein n=1 Tax=Ruegeria sp. TaxID=1879320 RepID=UPI003B00210E